VSLAVTCSYVNLYDNGSTDLIELVPVRGFRGNTESATPAAAGVNQEGTGEEAIKITSGDWKT